MANFGLLKDMVWWYIFSRIVLEMQKSFVNFVNVMNLSDMFNYSALDQQIYEMSGEPLVLAYEIDNFIVHCILGYLLVS